MKHILTYLCAFALLVPAAAQASTIDDAFEVLQQQIVVAYYSGDQQQVAQIFSIMLELLYAEGGYTHSSSDDDIEVETTGAENIDEDSARLTAEIDWNDADRGYIWFEYGEDEDDLDEDTRERSIDDHDDEYHDTIDDLDEDERYYYRAVVEDRDTGKRYYGDTEYFYTDGDRNEDEPEIDVDEADDVTDDSAELSGEVDMNDYRNGIVFFVWGEDEDQVEDIEHDYDEYRDIDEDGEDLQVYRIDSDLDGRGEYSLEVRGLDDDTDHYFTLCVEYEDEDDDEMILCGSVEEFETDN